WDSWIEISSVTAGKLGLSNGNVVRISAGEFAIEGPVYIQPSMHEDCLSIPIGQGINPIMLVPDRFNEAGGLVLIRMDISISKTDKHIALTKIQGSDRQKGRGIFRNIYSDDLDKNESNEPHREESLYPERQFPGYHWGMVIDLNLCIGCGACVLGCYAENNVPFVGKKLSLKGYQMNWLRIERYIEEENRGVSFGFLPMLCQHCANAPCEPVCPVYATVQNHEGLNTQVYSRCVGTRYCSNNCPYKVRRFNWFTYRIPDEFKRQRNPDVPARTKGIMEKCTFCIQRIREAKDRAKDEKRKVIDGEIKTACSESCPTGAIVFGDLNDREGRVWHLVQSKRAYRVFEGLNTKPSIYYLKKVRISI
ncbi:MAG: 4Fe-4S dicluster domain-containing protein, partial [Candidatus Omnitrophica bacterium]|nr:4Fe-4S dicluster domain-containing protein [Candidatus Omnitrophota bacterium]